MTRQTALSFDNEKDVYDIESKLNKWFAKGWRILPIVIKVSGGKFRSESDGTVVILELEEDR